MTASILHFPTPLRVLEQAPAGRHGFASPETVDITPAVDGYRLWLNGVEIAPFPTLSSAARAAMRLRMALEIV